MRMSSKYSSFVRPRRLSLLVVALICSAISVSCTRSDNSGSDDSGSDDPTPGPNPAITTLTTPVRIDVDLDATDLFVQFTAKDVVGNDGEIERIWTRAYGLVEDQYPRVIGL